MSLLLALVDDAGEEPTAVSALVLGTEPHTEILLYLLDEDPFAIELVSDSIRGDNAIMYGSGLPDNSWRTVFRFRGLSEKEELVPGGFDQGVDPSETSLRRILKGYYSGGELRVWRNFYQNFFAYRNEPFGDGYSDILPLDVQDEVNLAWGDHVMTRFEFLLEGVNTDADAEDPS